jgi:hypothetical protein
MASPGKSPHIEVPIDCPKCQTKQIVHMLARTGLTPMGQQVVDCVKCNESFSVIIPDMIIDGPFAV